MRTVIVGMGPTGLILGACLARRGHQVLGIDRDPGPTGQHWPRRGVMQFEHAHGFRPQVAQTLRQVWPEALNEWVRLGAEPVGLGPAADDVVMLSRRITFERALRQIAADCPDLTLRTGHVEDLMCEMGRTGVVVDGEQVAADLVVDASGRTGRIGREFGRDELDVSGDCGLAYVDRACRLKPGSPLGPMTTPVGHMADFDGYQCLGCLHEHGHCSGVWVRGWGFVRRGSRFPRGGGAGRTGGQTTRAQTPAKGAVCRASRPDPLRRPRRRPASPPPKLPPPPRHP